MKKEMQKRRMPQVVATLVAVAVLSLAVFQPMVTYALEGIQDYEMQMPSLAGQWRQYNVGVTSLDKDAQPETNWFYFDEDGWVKGGWFEYGGRLYYSNVYGSSGKDLYYPGDKVTYHFNQEVDVAKGEYHYLLEGTVSTWYMKATVENGFITSRDGQPVTTTTPATSNTSHWSQEAGLWYYTENGSLVKNQWSCISSEWYYFLEDGAMAIGWIQVENQWYYLETNGAMVTGTHIIDGKQCQFSESGNLTSEKPQ